MKTFKEYLIEAADPKWMKLQKKLAAEHLALAKENEKHGATAYVHLNMSRHHEYMANVHQDDKKLSDAHLKKSKEHEGKVK